MAEKKTKQTAAKSKAKAKAGKAKETAKEKALKKSVAELEQNIQYLEQELDDQKERVAAAEEKMLRVVAEYENGKKRLEREKERSLSFAKDRVLAGLFPIIDNLERSAKYEQEHEEVDSDKHGVHLVLDQIAKYLKETNNIEAFDPTGEPFDPEMHEAMAMHESEEHESGTVLEVFEKGYREGDRILRVAKVIVSQ
ncbi:MAG: nucleotide exchange factor GrpE [Candidatus Marinimicrobia bacterium]|nr:nucleotide exchange factor GrpE [Candidatus Neomarinimicrobiota bacterium]MCF7851011.1 nucleotide exchange factor GrpE [Candidatus Neomarinimicrobiota bacterium]MCF7904935.1 nucleotide exchange factor GrpE [Candidatus Neomarinimicrobiota bacterium]